MFLQDMFAHRDNLIQLFRRRLLYTCHQPAPGALSLTYTSITKHRRTHAQHVVVMKCMNQTDLSFSHFPPHRYGKSRDHMSMNDIWLFLVQNASHACGRTPIPNVDQMPEETDDRMFLLDLSKRPIDIGQRNTVDAHTIRLLPNFISSSMKRNDGYIIPRLRQRFSEETSSLFGSSKSDRRI